MNHPTLIDIACNAITQAHGEQPFLFSCLGFALLVGIIILIRSIYRLYRLTADEVDAEEAQGGC